MKHLFIVIAFFLAGSPCFSQLLQETYNHDGQEREYFLYLPDGLPQGAPLVFVLHGYTSSAEGIIDSYGMNAVADANGFAVCYPQGSQDITGTNFWNINFPLESVDDVGFLSNLAIDLSSLYNLDEACTYVSGMSNGGMMSYYLGCERPDVFKAIASVTGTITDNFIANCSGNIPVPFMQIHGTADIIVPYNGGDIAAETFGSFFPVEQIFRTWNNINDCQSVTTFSFPDAPVIDFSSVAAAEVTDCNGDLKARFYRVQGGGHTWPGAPPVPLIDFIQPTNQDISASAEIWNFFESICAPSGITENQNPSKDEGVDIFPNPSSDRLFLRWTGKNQTRVSIFSVEGKLMHQELIGEGQNELSLGHLSRGLYIVKVYGEDVHTKKLILE